MMPWKVEKRSGLIAYLDERGLLEERLFWKLAQARFEVLPRNLEERKLLNALLSERETLPPTANANRSGGARQEPL
jgi:hypothetical protein